MKEKIVKNSEEKNKCNCKNGEPCTCGDNCTCGDDCTCKENGTCTCGDDCKCSKEEYSSEDTINPLEEELLVLKNTVENLNEKVKVSQAELINYRKRKDEETSNLLKYANQDLIMEILPILDNFERALNMKLDTPEFQKYTEGYNILYSHLIDTLKKFGVEEIPAVGCEFDPMLHEAVMIGRDENKKEDEILEVFSKGYTLKGRVIRASKVRVNKL